MKEIQNDPKLEVRDLRLVQAVAARGGLTAAAARLHRTPSALSHQLRGLERRLRTALFHRVGKRLVPSEAGRRVLAAADGVLAELRRAEDEVDTLAAGRAATLRLATACYTSYHWLPGLLAVLSRRHPEIELRVLPALTADPLAALRAGRLDVAIVFSPVAGGPDLVVEPCFDDEMVVLAATGHPLAKRPYARPADLADLDLYLYSADPADSILLAEVLGPAGVVPRAVHAVPLTEAIVELVRSGRGVSFLATWGVAPFLARGGLAAVRMGKGGFHRTWSAVALPGSRAAEYLPALAAALRRVGDTPASIPGTGAKAVKINEVLKILASFERNAVEYAVIGGVAVNLHGIPRNTEDLDVFIRPSAENIDRLRTALREVYDDPQIDEISTEDLVGDYPAVRYYPPETDLYLDVLTRLGEFATFEDLTVAEIELGGTKIRLVTPRVLYWLKKGTVRDIDRLDAHHLKEKFQLDD